MKKFISQPLPPKHHLRRGITTIDHWLQDLEIRPFTFDRYRCEICFLGRQAESRIRNGTAKEEDKGLLDKCVAHQKIVKTQSAEVKKDKENVGPDQLCCVFDFSTFHDYTKEKVKKLVQLFLKTFFQLFNHVDQRSGDVREGELGIIFCRLPGLKSPRSQFYLQRLDRGCQSV